MARIINNTPFASFEDYKTQALAAGYPSHINPDYKPFSTLTINGQNRANEITFEKLFDPDFETLFPGTITRLTVRHRSNRPTYTLKDYNLTLEADSESIVLSGTINQGVIYEFYPPEEEFKAKSKGAYPSDLVFEKTFKGGNYTYSGYLHSADFYEVLNSPHLKDIYGGNNYVVRRYLYNLKIGTGFFTAFSRGFIGENNRPYDIDISGPNPVYFGVELVPSENPLSPNKKFDKINSGEIFFTPASPLKNIEISGDYGSLDDGFGKFYENLLIPNGATATFYDERIRNEKPIVVSSSGITVFYDDFGNLNITNTDDAETGYLTLHKSDPGPDPGGSDSDEEWWAMMQSSGSLK